jgi:hypothetical protein
MWPLSPSTLAVEAGVYDLRAVPFSSIAMVTNCVVKVRFPEILPFRCCKSIDIDQCEGHC